MNQQLPRSIDIAGVTHGKAPIPMGARVGPLLMSSAILGKDASTDALPADPLDQVKLAFSNLAAFLRCGGATWQDVVRLGVTVSDNALRDAVNAQWLEYFPDARDRPARHIVQAALQHGMVIQLEVTAYCLGERS